MLVLDDVHASYGQVAALRGVSLEVKQGEIVGLIGPNGAGKSTTLGTISGIVATSRGVITLEGKSLRGLTPDAIVRRGVSLVPEGRRIFGSLTVEENLRV